MTTAGGREHYLPNSKPWKKTVTWNKKPFVKAEILAYELSLLPEIPDYSPRPSEVTELKLFAEWYAI